MSVTVPRVPVTDPQDYLDFDFQLQGPLEFLEYLKTDLDATFPSVAIDGTHCGWIVESDIPALIELLDSDEPCRAVGKVISSFMATEPSTIGREAAWMIMGFQHEVENVGYGGYPPGLLSNHYGSDGYREAARSWWAEYQAKEPVRSR